LYFRYSKTINTLARISIVFPLFKKTVELTKIMVVISLFEKISKLAKIF